MLACGFCDGMTGRSPVYVGGERLDIIVARGQVISKPAGRHAGPAKEVGEVSVIRGSSAGRIFPEWTFP